MKKAHNHSQTFSCSCEHSVVATTHQVSPISFTEKTLWISSIIMWGIALFFLEPPFSSALFLLEYLIVGSPVIRKTFTDIAKGKIFTVNFLMLLATVGAFIIGEPAEGSIAMILYVLGEAIEDIAVYHSQKSITELLSLKPQVATLWKDDGKHEVSPETVAIGDIILVTTGEKIALDGIAIEGSACIDNSILTGESLPLYAKAGDTVLSGGLVREGNLKIRVTRPYQDSTISKVIDMIQNASSSKANSEKMMQRFTVYYTPAIVILAFLLTFVPTVFFSADLKTWLTRSLVFLAASCPCSLIISIPLTYFAGLKNASKNGVLIKGANYLEALSKVDTLIMDKTGTLTKGNFEILTIESPHYSQEEVLTMAAMMEQYSNHPIALSIRHAISERESTNSGEVTLVPSISPTLFQEISGKGILLNYEGSRYLCGNSALLRQYGVKYPDSTSPYSIVYLAKNEEYVGSITIADRLKDDTVSAIAALKKMGIRNFKIFTGDKTSIAEQVAQEVGIRDVMSEMLPDDKFRAVKNILEQQSGSKVAFVGDGINDASVLRLADVGIAMGGLGADIAVESADVILTGDNLSSLAMAIQISQKTSRILKQNLILSIGLKAVVLLLGGMGLVGMWAAIFADVGTMLLASFNGLRAGK